MHRFEAARRGRSRTRLSARIALMLGAVLSSAGAALALDAVPGAAAVTATVTPALPATVTVGTTGVSGSLQITNGSTSPDDTGNLTLNSITLVPSCEAGAPGGACPAGSDNPGVFTLASSATGDPASACASTTFSVSVTDPTQGLETFTPSSPVVLGPPGSATATCTIDFTFSVNQSPATTATPAPAPGTAISTYALGAVTGTNDNSDTGGGSGVEAVSVAPAQPSISGAATPSVVVGGYVSDLANLTPAAAPAPAPTGSISFAAFSPADTTCSTPLFSSSTPIVSGTLAYGSASFAPGGAGTYTWVATYSGDANNAPASTPCGTLSQQSIIEKATPSLHSTASAPVTIGGAISDHTTISGGYAPGGTITFTGYGPDDPTCARTAVVTRTVTVSGNDTYSSGDFTPPAAGSYTFSVTYSGDGNNNGGSTACGASGQTTAVSKAAPTLASAATASVVVGQKISDAATLSGGVTPTGAITFELFGPNDSGCSGAAVAMSTVPVTAGNGVYTSDPFTATAAGTYAWRVTYSGDTNNNSVPLTACGAAGSASAVQKATPTLTVQASAPTIAGGQISDTAILAGLATQSGSSTITFEVFGPNNATCSGTPNLLSIIPVNRGDSLYSSDPYTAARAGTYRWQASYSGDANNNAVALSSCSLPAQAVTVNLAGPSISTVSTSAVKLGSGQVAGSATLSSGELPTGTITFEAFGPVNATCSSTPAFRDSVRVTGNGTYHSSNFSPPGAGMYRWVASYSGDANNISVQSVCGDAHATSTVAKATPQLASKATKTVMVGGKLADVATISGLQLPQHLSAVTISFQLFDTKKGTCTGSPLMRSEVSGISADGQYQSSTFTPIKGAILHWLAVYSGDANNAATLSGCTASTVNKAKPSLKGKASPALLRLGGVSNYTAALASTFRGTGNLTFGVFGPYNPVCTGTPVATFSSSVHGDGRYLSGTFRPKLAGTYRWRVLYSGDAANTSIHGKCGPTGAMEIVLPSSLPFGVLGVFVPNPDTGARQSIPSAAIALLLSGGLLVLYGVGARLAPVRIRRRR